MAYSDIQMVAFSQIAYMDLGDMLDAKKAGGADKLDFSDVTAWMDRIRSKPESERTPLEKHNLSHFETIEKMGISREEMNSWRIAAEHNTNEPPGGNGFSCTLIETAPGKAVVGFRGSDELTSYFALRKDWSGADIALLIMERQTEQQAEAERFFSDIEIRKLMLGYDDLAYTGHSLGGNLAEYSAMVAYKYGLSEKVSQTVSLDGPGFSDDFLKLHADEIAAAKSKMQHISWSFVGELLWGIEPVDKRRFGAVEDGWDPVSRHDCNSLLLIGGSIVPGEQDDFSKVISKLTKELDEMPRAYGDAAALGAMGALNIFSLIPEGLEKTPGLWSGNFWEGVEGVVKLGAGVYAGVKIGLPMLLATAGILLLTMISSNNDGNVIEAVIEKIGDLLTAFENWTSQKLTEFKNFCMNLLKGMSDWWKSIVDAGYKYAQNHSLIKADTAKLRDFGDRIGKLDIKLSAYADVLKELSRYMPDTKGNGGSAYLIFPGVVGDNLTNIKNSFYKMAEILEQAETDIVSMLTSEG